MTPCSLVDSYQAFRGSSKTNMYSMFVYYVEIGMLCDTETNRTRILPTFKLLSLILYLHRALNKVTQSANQPPL